MDRLIAFAILLLFFVVIGQCFYLYYHELGHKEIAEQFFVRTNITYNWDLSGKTQYYQDDFDALSDYNKTLLQTLEAQHESTLVVSAICTLLSIIAASCFFNVILTLRKGNL